MALVNELQKDQGSRLYASIAGWEYPMSRTEYYAAGMFVKLANMHRPEGSTPINIHWPFPLSKARGADVTDEEREALTAKLRATSAFGQIRNT